MNTVDNEFVRSVNGQTPDENGNVEIPISEVVNEVLAQAKASGEFKGEPGKDGQDGKDYIPNDPYIHSLEISGYEQKAFYGRVIAYGR